MPVPDSGTPVGVPPATVTVNSLLTSPSGRGEKVTEAVHMPLAGIIVHAGASGRR